MSRSDRHLWWSLILYADSESYHFEGVKNKLLEWSSEYYYICHDQDGIKTHWHFIVKLRDSKERLELIKHLGMLDSDFKDRNEETVKFIDAYRKNDAIVYLTHLNAPEKYQYDFEKVTTNVQENYKTIITNYKNKTLDPYKELYEFIKLSDSDVEMVDVLDYAAELGQVKCAMKSYYALNKMCNSYNVIRHTRNKGEKKND